MCSDYLYSKTPLHYRHFTEHENFIQYHSTKKKRKKLLLHFKVKLTDNDGTVSQMIRNFEHLNDFQRMGLLLGNFSHILSYHVHML